MMRPAFVKLSREDGIKMFPVSSKAFEPYFPLPIHVYICSANTYSNVEGAYSIRIINGNITVDIC